MSEFSRETLLNIIETDHVQCGEASALARMALATMDSEPVALQPELAKVIYHFRDWNEGFPVERFKADYVISWMLANYPPAQPAPVVDADDNFYSWFGREWAENYQHNQYTTAAKQMLGVMAESAWKAGRRAAMLAAAPQSPGSEPAIVPGTWIPVSERMPETDGNYWGWWSESKRQGPVWFIKSELQAQFQSTEITHWMPLPADPQEVK